MTQPSNTRVMKTNALLVLVLILTGCASIQSKYANTTTPEMQLRHRQIEEWLVSEKNGMDIKIGSPFMMMGDGGRKDRINEKEEIEKELLRRYQSGDKAAYLAMFGDTR